MSFLEAPGESPFPLLSQLPESTCALCPIPSRFKASSVASSNLLLTSAFCYDLSFPDSETPASLLQRPSWFCWAYANNQHDPPSAGPSPQGTSKSLLPCMVPSQASGWGHGCLLRGLYYVKHGSIHEPIRFQNSGLQIQIWDLSIITGTDPQFQISKALKTDSVFVLKLHANAFVSKAWQADLNFKNLYLSQQYGYVS